MIHEISHKLAFIAHLFPSMVLIVSIAIGGWLFTSWLRTKKSYLLEGACGKAINPKNSQEQMERSNLLGAENAQLRAELGSIKDRLATIERIVTDDGYRLSQEIEALRVTN